MMQCPNCRKIEKGNWLYGNGCCFFPVFNTDGWRHDEELYDFNYLEMVIFKCIFTWLSCTDFIPGWL
ncbi:hypothetical protein AXF42_Ash016458 [Apostasia shenzhenica]|uniref:Uncharacterized protein n=1 Tax=Apostasia shenzhenica TaxID=1088818 RepID=A0A2I0A091_9ASPA|nr:hypothetical protein AXF42_Ash016458 [Apostasia shenzhenica]